MTTDRPRPGSAWAARCPDAYPYEWYAALGLSALPVGYTRFATDEEVALITRAVTADEFRRAGGSADPVPPSPGVGTSATPVRGDRFRTLNAFVDAALRDLTRAELAVWLVIFRDVRADVGTATVSQRSIAGRAGLSVRAVQTAVGSLAGRGLLTVARRGRLGSGASVYRVSGVATDTAANPKPASGCKAKPASGCR
jgi:hypothetical protein